MVNIDIRTRDDLVSQQPFTPWGEPWFYQTICDGLSFIASTGHGGFRLSQDFAERILPPELRRSNWDGYHYFEEDCEWALLLLFLRDKEPELYAAINRDQLKLSKEDFDRRVNEMVEDYFSDYAHYIDGRTLEHLYVRVSENASEATRHLVYCAEMRGKGVGTIIKSVEYPEHSSDFETLPIATDAKAFFEYNNQTYEVTKHFDIFDKLGEDDDYRVSIRIWFDKRAPSSFKDIEIASGYLLEVLEVQYFLDEVSTA